MAVKDGNNDDLFEVLSEGSGNEDPLQILVNFLLKPVIREISLAW